MGDPHPDVWRESVSGFDSRAKSQRIPSETSHRRVTRFDLKVERKAAFELFLLFPKPDQTLSAAWDGPFSTASTRGEKG